MRIDGHQNENLEIKARVRDMKAIREAARELATDQLPPERQIDTYFGSCQGRLKLRERSIGHEAVTAQLIHYVRTDTASVKSSHYRIVEIAAAEPLKRLLAEAYGFWQVVVKDREIFLHENVRIHLDRVEGLGDFCELEAVQTDVENHETQSRLVDWLASKLAIQSGDLIASSYSDLLANRHPM